MKRIISLLAAMVLVVGMVTVSSGCSNGGGGNVSSGNADDLKGKDLTLVSFTDLLMDQEGTAFNNAKKHYESTTGGAVNFRRYHYSAFITKMITLIGSGNSPDLAYCRYAEMPKLGAMEILQPVDDYIKPEETNYPKVAEAYSLHGKHYALRVEQVQPYMVWYNKTILQNYGCDDPYTVWKNNPADWNWEKFEEIAVACTDDRDRDGVTDLWGYASIPYFGPSNGVSWITAEGDDVKITWKEKPSLDAFNFMQRLRFDLECVSPNNELGTTNFKTGDVAMTQGTFQFLWQFANTMDPATIGVVPLPQGDNFNGTYTCMSNLLGIVNGAPNPAGAAYFCKYMNEQDRKNYAEGEEPLGHEESEALMTPEMLEVSRYVRNNATVVMQNGWGDWDQESNAIWLNLFWDKQDVVATLDSLEPVVQAAINETLSFQMPEVKDFAPQPAVTFENDNMSYLTFSDTAAVKKEITTDTAQVIEGQSSLLVSSDTADAVVLRSDPDKLAIPTYRSYKITFDWKVLDSVDPVMGCDFYATIRPLTDINSSTRQVGSVSFGGIAGDSGTAELTVSLTGSANDYTLALVAGLNCGSVVIDNVNIVEDDS